MLAISKQTDYAVRMVLHLAALEPGALVSITDLAKSRHLPVPFVRRTVGLLTQTGVLEALRGARGGLRLGRPAAEISLLDVLVAVEGPIALNSCQEAERTCPLVSGCPVGSVWTGASRVLEDHLRAVRFSDLASDHHHRRAHRAWTSSSSLDATNLPERTPTWMH